MGSKRQVELKKRLRREFKEMGLPTGWISLASMSQCEWAIEHRQVPDGTKAPKPRDKAKDQGDKVEVKLDEVPTVERKTHSGEKREDHVAPPAAQPLRIKWEDKGFDPKGKLEPPKSYKKASFKGVEVEVPVLDKDVAAHFSVPVKKGYSFDQKKSKFFTQCLRDNVNLFNYGPRGCGKTSMVKQICAKLKYPCVVVSNHGHSEASQYIGTFVARDGQTVWQDGSIVQAMRIGACLVIDEISGTPPEVLMSIRQVLDGEPLLIQETGEVVSPAKGFYIWATDNHCGTGDESGNYTGTNVMNAADIDRFQLSVEWGYPSKAKEATIICKQTDIEKEEAHKIAEFASIIRKARKNQEVNYDFSLRRSVALARTLQMGVKDTEAVALAIVNSANPADRPAIAEAGQRVFGGQISIDPADFLSDDDEEKITEVTEPTPPDESELAVFRQKVSAFMNDYEFTRSAVASILTSGGSDDITRWMRHEVEVGAGNSKSINPAQSKVVVDELLDEGDYEGLKSMLDGWDIDVRLSNTVNAALKSIDHNGSKPSWNQGTYNILVEDPSSLGLDRGHLRSASTKWVKNVLDSRGNLNQSDKYYLTIMMGGGK